MAIKEYLKKSKAVNLIFWLWMNRKDKDFMNVLISGNRHAESLYIKSALNSSVCDRQAVFVIGPYENSEGFFSLVRWTLDEVYFAKQHGLVPVVRWSDNVLYFDKGMPSDMDPYKYYFLQPANIKASEIADHPTLTNRYSRQYTEDINEGDNSCLYSETLISAYAETVRTSVRINEATQKLIDEHILSYKLNDRILGVHIRGTDFKVAYKGHARYVAPEDYFEYIDEAFSGGAFDKIYLATDDDLILNELIDHYGSDRVIYANGHFRASDKIGVHFAQSEKYRVGLEVLLDVMSLAHCGGIITGLSNVGQFARVYREALGKKYSVNVLIDNGVNRRGKSINALRLKRS